MKLDDGIVTVKLVYRMSAIGLIGYQVQTEKGTALSPWVVFGRMDSVTILGLYDSFQNAAMTVWHEEYLSRAECVQIAYDYGKVFGIDNAISRRTDAPIADFTW